jgi:serine/threonine protein kinase
MALTPGIGLGPYEIQSPIGSGGMGEVYRTKDTRLDRTVAVKVLPSHLSENPEAKQRFDREARAISSLNHSNICTLHDVGHQDGTGGKCPTIHISLRFVYTEITVSKEPGSPYRKRRGRNEMASAKRRETNDRLTIQFD